MYSAYQDREELEDELYQEDSGLSEADSELEFHLYSQLHYSSNAGEIEELEAGAEKQYESRENRQGDVLEKTRDGDQELKYKKGSRPTPSSNDHLKVKKKAALKKKGKIKSKGQKLSSLRFEEVIVIDSSPDVISISDEDNDSDDDGVCAFKGQGSRQLQTSTPAQKALQKGRSPLVPVAVLSSSTESSESQSDSDSSDSTDADDLENWMILGQGKQDGDRSISLNVEGGSYSSGTDAEEEEEEEEGGSWIVSEKDKEAQIFNKGRGPRTFLQRPSSRYYTGKSVHCRNCNKTGHLSKNCPDPKKLMPCFLCGTTDHLASQCPNKHCNNCGQPGHLFNSCSERAYWHKQCHRCSMRGHFIDACPEIWRQYHITTKRGPPVKQQEDGGAKSPAYCYNCSKKGHLGHECKQQRMFSGVFPNYPFINHYDTLKDINRRQHRIEMKVKDIGRNGAPSAASPAPPTPGPPKKKQKRNHYKDSPNSKHTPYQTPNRANPNHIIFNDDDFDSTPRRKPDKSPKSGSSAKPWKPKRPLPATRDPLPLSKLVVDEASDFPRGGGPQGDKEGKMKKKSKFRKKQGNLFMSEEQKDWKPGHVYRTEEERSRGPKPKNQMGEKKKQRKFPNKTPKKQAGKPMYEEDNLFLIKQRKRSR
ncbi:PREDICTED: zinc finger CCHC domain-containing protein 7 [Cyprinodon variegatus]|uniref:Zinc finger CCHC domain-containing protein 7 n=1 Tax=Cyprinodon variegatus TaxID=28743 RepID=A0A3Q2DC87_CYPVA|nr:PREDICTED: zinc finger CCHC domain-containing protein 7 [Cyprinodon variegatus]